MIETNTLTAGIDTAKAKLDIAVHGSPRSFAVANDLSGWQRLAGELAAIGVNRIGIEASGGYERGVVRHLRAAGFRVVVLQPLQVKAYARLHLRRLADGSMPCDGGWSDEQIALFRSWKAGGCAA